MGGELFDYEGPTFVAIYGFMSPEFHQDFTARALSIE
jgi:hypothetical protein